MNEQPITFSSGALHLEGLLAIPNSGLPARAAVVCHPHPQYGGSMHNSVVDAILDALWTHHVATLRFNFRGVGASDGQYDGGAGESADASAALEFLITRDGVRRDSAILAGYSFGAIVAARAGVQLAEVGTIVAVAPPLAMTDWSFLGGSGKRIVLACGDQDSYCPAADLEALAARLGTSCQAVKLIGGADHFFGGREYALADALRAALAGR